MVTSRKGRNVSCALSAVRVNAAVSAPAATSIATPTSSPNTARCGAAGASASRNTVIPIANSTDCTAASRNAGSALPTRISQSRTSPVRSRFSTRVSRRSTYTPTRFV